MISMKRKTLLLMASIVDLAIIAASFILTFCLVYQDGSFSMGQMMTMRFTMQNVLIFLTWLLVFHAILRACNLYQSRRLASPVREVIDILKANAMGTVTLVVAAILFHMAVVTQEFIVTFWIISSCGLIAFRLFIRSLQKEMRRQGRNLRNMLIVGTNKRAAAFADKICAEADLGYRIVGFVDEDWRGKSDFSSTGYKIVADFDHFGQFIRENVVDEVMIFLPIKSFYNQISKVIEKCEEQGIVIRYASDLFHVKICRYEAFQFQGSPVVTLKSGNMEGNWQLFAKRCVDLVGSAVLLVLSMPVMLVVALLIKLTSSGPVLFSQQRVGQGKRKFNLYKFRTMVADAEKQQANLEHLNNVSGPVFKIEDDPRITPIGRWLRKTSIDELPQLFNVLKGEMSLVGPRPLPIRDYNGFNADWQRRRFSVKPGLTCLWQVNGRNDIPFEKWMELDLQYIDEWCLSLDIKILLKTIPAVLNGTGH